MVTIYVGSVESPLFTFNEMYGIYGTGGKIAAIESTNNIDIVGDQLSIDTFCPIVLSAHKVVNYTSGLITIGPVQREEIHYEGPSELTTLPYGTAVYYEVDNEIRARYFLQSVERKSDLEYKLNCVSVIGILDCQVHYGGMYTNETFQNVLLDILGITDGSNTFITAEDLDIPSNVASIRVDGYLPIGTRRSNLQQLLFASGVSITKGENGLIKFVVFKRTDEAITVSDANVYNEGAFEYNVDRTEVIVTEYYYTYDSNTAEECLLDMDSVATSVLSNVIVQFYHPIKVDSLRTTGSLVIDATRKGVNYAVVSGSGNLYGKPYSEHSHAATKKNDEATVPTNAVTCSNVKLINVLNSQDILFRLYNYYINARRLVSNWVWNGEKCGDKIAINDAFCEPKSGYISKMLMNASTKNKVEADVITNYTPTSRTIVLNNVQVLTGSGSWPSQAILDYIKAKDYPCFRVVCIGGGQGGSGGYAGSDGSSGSYKTSKVKSPYTQTAYGGSGGTGGTGGNGGNSGKVFISNVIDAANLYLNQYSFSCAEYGYGGDGETTYTRSGTTYHYDPTDGNYSYSRPESTFGSFSSYDGTRSDTGYQDPINLITYGKKGLSGAKGGNGGSGGNVKQTSKTAFTAYSGSSSESVRNRAGNYYGSSHYGSSYKNTGGGAAGGGAGGCPAFEAYSSTDDTYASNGSYSSSKHIGGNGAAGNDADYAPETSYLRAMEYPYNGTYGSGGNGGSGAGGGGGGGAVIGSYAKYITVGSGGKGSTEGGYGNYGMPGCILIYY